MARPSVDTAVILDAAAALIADRGVDHITMDAIAFHAAVAKGVLYLRFSSKDDLLAAVINRELILATRATLALVEGDPRGGLLSRQFAHSLTALRSRPALLRLYRGDVAHLARLARAGDPSRLRADALLGAEYLAELQREGLVDASLDTDAFATNLALWNHGLAARADDDDVERLIDGMADLVARAADVETGDAAAGKRCFARFGEALIGRRSSP